MDIQIRPIRTDSGDKPRLVELSLAAWEPVFVSFENVLGTDVFLAIYPDWQTSQRQAIEDLCKTGGPMEVWVAEVAGQVAGFVAYEFNHQNKAGEVQYLAVDPAFQKRGVGAALNAFALEKLKEGGMELAVVGTGGDPGHAPARRSYERAGYVGLPLVRYYKKL